MGGGSPLYMPPAFYPIALDTAAVLISRAWAGKSAPPLDEPVAEGNSEMRGQFWWTLFCNVFCPVSRSELKIIWFYPTSLSFV